MTCGYPHDTLRATKKPCADDMQTLAGAKAYFRVANCELSTHRVRKSDEGSDSAVHDRQEQSAAQQTVSARPCVHIPACEQGAGSGVWVLLQARFP
jgi:hypothetical protein